MKIWKLFKECVDASRMICELRKAGATQKLLIVFEDEYDQLTKLLNIHVKEIDLLQECMEKMIAGGSPCEYCEDFSECQMEDKSRGCKMWWLRYLTKEERIACGADMEDE